MALRGAGEFEILTYSAGNPLFPTLRDPNADKLPKAALEYAGAGTLPARLRRPGLHGAARPLSFVDWYVEEYWISPNPLDFGNIARDVTRTFSVFSTHVADHTLDSIDLSPIQPGVDFDALSFPLTIESYESVSFDITAEQDGLASFDEEIPFVFDNASILVRILGARVTAWDIEPNWLDDVLERQLWNTNVIESEDAHEQRIKLRQYPRIEYEFTFDVAKRRRQRHQAMIERRGAGLFLVPIFSDGYRLEADLPAGSTAIAIDFSTELNFRAGLEAMLIFGDESEVVDVAAVGSASITLEAETLAEWPAGTRIYPARLARLVDPRQTAALVTAYSRGIALFKTVREIEADALSAETEYQGAPVLELEPNWIEPPAIEYTSKLFEFDPGTGLDFVLDRAGVSLPVEGYRYTCADRAAADALRRWCYSRAGRFKGLWVPTWAEDLELYSTLSSGTTDAIVHNVGLEEFAIPDAPHRRDIRIELVDGSVYYRRISAAVVLDVDREQITIDAGLTGDVDPEDVRRISWMHYSRLDSDAIEIAWHTWGACDVTLRFKAPNHDL